MPLPVNSNRTPVHHRSIEMRGYRRDDGLYEIDGHVVDRKSHPMRVEGRPAWSAGEAIHDMWVRLVVDQDLVVHEVVAVSDSTPYPVCREATEPMQRIVGERIAPGWSNVVKARLGGAIGCTHLMELLIPMGTAAFQTLAEVRLARPDKLDALGRPTKINSCYAFASHREIVERRWPAFHTAAPPTLDKRRTE